MKVNDVLTLIFSSGALIFSLLNYRRGKRYESENYLFKAKVEVYTKILCDIEKLIRFLGKSIGEAREYMADSSKENRKCLDNLADEVDETCYEFNNYITGHSLVIPEKIVRLLSNFCDKILDNESLDSQSKIQDNSITEAEKFIDELIVDAEMIGVELRKDAHIDELNSSLFRRLK
jgi:hypothetical protein